MTLGEGIRCGNPGMGVATTAITAAGYYFTARHAWKIFEKEAVRSRCKTDNRNDYTVEISHSITAIVNMTFACELAFKSLLTETDRACTHGLRELYDRLDPIYQREIKDRAKAILDNSDDSSFLEGLNECSNNFVKWRYFYEPNKIGGQAQYLFIQP